MPRRYFSILLFTHPSFISSFLSHCVQKPFPVGSLLNRQITLFNMHVQQTFLVLAALTTTIFAHPGADIQEEIQERAAYLKQTPHVPRDLSHCAAKLKARGIEKATIERRAAKAKALREKKGIAVNAPFLKARDAGTVLNTTHLSPVNYTLDTPEDILFAGNASCILSPEVTEGPFCEYFD